jgi:hypothetical protein
MGYVALTNTLTWFHKKGVELEYDDYLHMLKMVGLSYISDRFCLAQPLFSFDTGPIVLEVTTPRSSRPSFPNGSIANSIQILQSTSMISIPADSPTMRAASCSARLSLIGATRCK